MNTRDMRSYVGTLTMPATHEAWAVHQEVVETDFYRFRELHESGFRPRMIWDLGASWGVASAVMAHWWPEAAIWAFEPQAERSRFAVGNCRVFPNVRVFETGLVGYLHSDDAAALAGIASDSNWRESRQVMLELVKDWGCISVSAFLEEHPLPGPIDLIKVDIEGCEIGVFRELRQLGLLRTVEHVRGEWHNSAFHELPRVLAESHEVAMDRAPPSFPWTYFQAVRIAKQGVVSVWLEG